MTVIVDSSFVIALAIQEPAARAANQIMAGWTDRGEQICAPVLLDYEIASALTKAVRFGRITMDSMSSVWQYVHGLRIQRYLVSDAPALVSIAIRLQRQSAYDAAYLLLARQMHAALWTLDGPLARNAVTLGFDVRLVEP